MFCLSEVYSGSFQIFMIPAIKAGRDGWSYDYDYETDDKGADYSPPSTDNPLIVSVSSHSPPSNFFLITIF